MSQHEDKAFTELKAKYPSIMRFGLRKTLHKIYRDHLLARGEYYTEAELKEFSVDFSYPNFCPDAVWVDGSTTTLRVWEIINTNPISERKRLDMQMFAHNLYDSTFWSMEVWVYQLGIERRVYNVMDEIL